MKKGVFLLTIDSDDALLTESFRTNLLMTELKLKPTIFYRLSKERKDEEEPEIFKDCIEREFELNPHPYLFDEDSTKAFNNEIKRFNTITGVKATGFRNHGLVWRREYIKLAKQLGLTYSSNLFIREYKLSHHDSRPFKYEGGLIEVPILFMNSEDADYDLIKSRFKATVQQGNPFCIDIHSSALFRKHKYPLLEKLVIELAELTQELGVESVTINEYLNEVKL